MERRKFILGGGVFGVVAALASATTKAAEPEGAVVLCEMGHIPIENYKSSPAICIANKDDPSRALVPCKNCGILFALPIKPKG